ncbi:SDR family NAD(P)-dependent oxidoreductase [Sphaerisporangium perillae]|uniref:SDR family NAD(P)-dependent oxidoreductase n=1 Tax=Sphaerisporangium perillae TaxID=2935860 RepID=UPI00355905DA
MRRASDRPLALVTGAGRTAGIAAAVVGWLAESGWDVAWLLIREYGLRHRVPFGEGRIVGLTSDHTVFNLPYGASKAALDRITIAAARELAHLGVTANVINPGPTDTGWIVLLPVRRPAAARRDPEAPDQPRRAGRHPVPPRPAQAPDRLHRPGPRWDDLLVSVPIPARLDRRRT